MSRIKEYFDWMAGLPQGAPHIERFVHKHGRKWIAQALPPGLRIGKKKMCFRNAANLAMDGGLRYIEGFAISTHLPFPVLHAWCVDKDDHVVDPTWDDPELCEYFGVEIKTETLRDQLLENRMWGVLSLNEMANVKFFEQWENRLERV